MKLKPISIIAMALLVGVLGGPLLQSWSDLEACKSINNDEACSYLGKFNE